jgi:RHS repeat-associated protein
MAVAGQPIVNYTYDTLDRLTNIAQGSSSVGLQYDSASRRQSVTLPNGVIVANAYDAAGHINGVTYQKGANILGNLSYVYDGVGRSSGLSGSLARAGLPGAVNSANYDAANRLTNWGGQVLSYDANGNLTGDGLNIYNWNGRNQLSSITGSANASFAYDPLGRRVSKSVGAATTGYLYDGLNVVQELSGTSPMANLLSGGLDEVFRRTDSSASSFLTDPLGSTVALTDSTGALTTQYSYEPFGKASASGPTSGNPFQFTGRENDGTGLQFDRARYYSPTFGRFISQDPIGIGGGDVNLYAYVANDPINLTDPSGLTWTSNWNYFWNWALGRGPRTRKYGPNDLETQELMNSRGVNQLRDTFNQDGCKSQRHLSYGTFEAYWDTVANPFTADWSNTAAEVGGFGGASIINNGNGTATFTIPNTSGTNSFFLHAVPNRQSPTGPMSNIYQTFQWTEPLQTNMSGRKSGC